MSEKHRLAELQLAIMQVLWDRGKSTVGEVREALQPDRDLAYTTVGTMLTNLEEKGFVTHQSSGRVNIYCAKLRREQVRRSMVTDLAHRLFAGDLEQMVCHLLDGSEVTRDDITRLKKLIREKELELKDAR